MTTPFTQTNPNAVDQSEHSPSFPDAMIRVEEDTLNKFTSWLGEQVQFMVDAWQEKVDKWAEEELDYRALPDPPKERPFKGACTEVIPAIAMAVDPIYARLSTSTFKTDRIVRIKALDKTLQPCVDALERFVEYYLRYYLRFRQVLDPRLLESTKHGHFVLRVEFEDDTQPIVTYGRDKDGNFVPVERKLTKCKGPKITGIPIQNFIYPARFQNIQEAPVVLECFYMTEQELAAEVKAGRMSARAAKMSTATDDSRTTLDEAHEDSAQHHHQQRGDGWVRLYRFACKYDINGDGFQESLLGVWDQDTQSVLQLRYNWYFHQRYPYVLVPYSVVNGDIGGFGLCEMIRPFQRSMTDWHQQLWNNAYIANARVIVRKRESQGATGDPISWYAGKEIYADDPSKDFVALQMGDVYTNSNESMMQSLMGYVEKRTGVSDYLTGRESPIVGSRATATSTVALIQEGTKRVEQTQENLRVGLAETVEMMIYIWMQFGTQGLESKIFDEETAGKIIEFFDKAREMDLGSSLVIELAATDASNNKAVQQQLQLALIQTFTGFYQQLIVAAQQASAAASTNPALAQLIGQVMTDAKSLYTDLATKYDVRNPEEYIPDLEAFLGAIGAAGSAVPSPFATAQRPQGFGGMAAGPGGFGGPAGPGAQAGGAGVGAGGGIPAPAADAGY